MTGRAVVPLGLRRAPERAPGRALAPDTVRSAGPAPQDSQAGPGLSHREARRDARRDAEGGLWRDVWSQLRIGGREHGRVFVVAGGIGAGATGIGLLVVPDVATVLADVAAVGLVAAVIVVRRTRWGRRVAGRWGHLLVERPRTVPGLWEAVPDDWRDDHARPRTRGPVDAVRQVVPVTVTVVKEPAAPRPVGGPARALPARSGVAPFPVVDVDSARVGSAVPR